MTIDFWLGALVGSAGCYVLLLLASVVFDDDPLGEPEAGAE